MAPVIDSAVVTDEKEPSACLSYDVYSGKSWIHKGIIDTLPSRATARVAMEKNMMPAKEEVKRILQQLPDDTTLEDIQHHIYIRQKVDHALDDVANGPAFVHSARDLSALIGVKHNLPFLSRLLRSQPSPFPFLGTELTLNV